jgi:hypothetical protein
MAGCLLIGSRELLTSVRTGYSGRQGDVPFPHAPLCWSRCHSARRAVRTRGGGSHAVNSGGDGVPPA